MAEVLITLAIIGVVAAMTIPTLITNYKAKVLETKLQRMYSLMSNAISLSTIDNGETTSWNYKQGDLSTTYSEVLAWYEKYLSPYLKVLEVKQQEGSEDLLIYLLDGSILEIENIIYDMDFYTNEAALKNSKSGANHFFFRFQPTLNESQTDAPEFANVTSPNFNSYGFCWDGTYEGAKHSSCSNGCYENGALCSKLLHLNNWRIPDDYPYNL